MEFKEYKEFEEFEEFEERKLGLRALWTMNARRFLISFRLSDLVRLALFSNSLNSFFRSISPETDRVAFLVNALEPTARRVDDQIQVFRFAFERVNPEGFVFHVHLGGG